MSTESFTAGDVEREYGIDLLTAETLRLMLIGVSRQMFGALVRGAFSMVVRDMQDCSAAVLMDTPERVELVSSAEGCPMHAFTVQTSGHLVMREWGVDNLNQGDVVMVNDPYRGAIHQGDVNFFRPVFWEGEPVFVCYAVSHFADIGGPGPGGFWGPTKDLFEEGLRFPPTLVYSEDKPVRSAFNLLLENVRTPRAVLGDMRALYGSLCMGERLMLEVIERYGIDAVRAGARYSLDYAERSMRAGIAEMPDGDWEIEDHLDFDGVTEELHKIKVSARKRGDSIELDYSGSARQPVGSCKAGLVDLTRVIQGVKMMVDPHTPVNGGTLRPVDVVAPVGSIACPLPPASVGNHAPMAIRTGPLGLGVISKGLPDRACAMEGGESTFTAVGGLDTRPGHGGEPWGTFFVVGQGMGGTPRGRGLGVAIPMSANARGPVVEYIEREMPLIVHAYEIMINSGGAGKNPGGVAATAVIETLTPCVATGTGTRVEVPSQGIFGGGPGGLSYAFEVGKDEDGIVPSVSGLVPAEFLGRRWFGKYAKNGRPDPIAGDRWGDPLDRDAEAVLADVRNEYISRTAARVSYGVIFEGTAGVDAEATARERERLRLLRARGGWAVPIPSPW
jgi:N-methylhydantoinase B